MTDAIEPRELARLKLKHPTRDVDLIARKVMRAVAAGRVVDPNRALAAWCEQAELSDSERLAPAALRPEMTSTSRGAEQAREAFEAEMRATIEASGLAGKSPEECMAILRETLKLADAAPPDTPAGVSVKRMRRTGNWVASGRGRCGFGTSAEEAVSAWQGKPTTSESAPSAVPEADCDIPF